MLNIPPELEELLFMSIDGTDPTIITESDFQCVIETLKDNLYGNGEFLTDEIYVPKVAALYVLLAGYPNLLNNLKMLPSSLYPIVNYNIQHIQYEEMDTSSIEKWLDSLGKPRVSAPIGIFM